MATSLSNSTNISYLMFRFNYICAQVNIINSQIMAIDLRNKKALSDNIHSSFIYSNNIKLLTLEGTRTVFYEMAVLLGDKICLLKKENSTD